MYYIFNINLKKNTNSVIAKIQEFNEIQELGIVIYVPYLILCTFLIELFE